MTDMSEMEIIEKEDIRNLKINSANGGKAMIFDILCP